LISKENVQQRRVFMRVKATPNAASNRGKSYPGNSLKKYSKFTPKKPQITEKLASKIASNRRESYPENSLKKYGRPIPKIAFKSTKKVTSKIASNRGKSYPENSPKNQIHFCTISSKATKR
jgi:hypothetical protein